jgi:CAAX protease family protein
MLRGPRHRWWKPLLALGLAGAIAFVGQIVAFGPFVVFGLVATGGRRLGEWLSAEISKLATADIDAAGFFYTNLSLIVLIPATGLSIWAVHRIRPRFVSAVTGGFRWRWLVRCLVIVVPIWILYTLAGILLDGSTAVDRPAQWVTLMVLVVLMTPLQAAGEEYFFRGWILQNVGSWFKRPLISLASGTLVSAVAFSVAHGSPDPWIIGSLVVFAVSCCLLTWRTGGLEAAIAIHAVNNISVFFAVINFGGWNEAFIGAETKGDPVEFAIDAVVQIIAFALIWWQAKRAKISPVYRPPPAAPVPGMPNALAPSPVPRQLG